MIQFPSSSKMQLKQEKGKYTFYLSFLFKKGEMMLHIYVLNLTEHFKTFCLLQIFKIRALMKYMYYLLPSSPFLLLPWWFKHHTMFFCRLSTFFLYYRNLQKSTLFLLNTQSLERKVHSSNFRLRSNIIKSFIFICWLKKKNSISKEEKGIR